MASSYVKIRDIIAKGGVMKVDRAGLIEYARQMARNINRNVETLIRNAHEEERIVKDVQNSTYATEAGLLRRDVSQMDFSELRSYASLLNSMNKRKRRTLTQVKQRASNIATKLGRNPSIQTAAAATHDAAAVGILIDGLAKMADTEIAERAAQIIREAHPDWYESDVRENVITEYIRESGADITSIMRAQAGDRTAEEKAEAALAEFTQNMAKWIEDNAVADTVNKYLSK